jgi:hypothetical protein
MTEEAEGVMMWEEMFMSLSVGVILLPTPSPQKKIA